jgi:hypothetical protein
MKTFFKGIGQLVPLFTEVVGFIFIVFPAMALRSKASAEIGISISCEHKNPPCSSKQSGMKSLLCRLSNRLTDAVLKEM